MKAKFTRAEAGRLGIRCEPETFEEQLLLEQFAQHSYRLGHRFEFSSFEYNSGGRTMREGLTSCWGQIVQLREDDVAAATPDPKPEAQNGDFPCAACASTIESESIGWYRCKACGHMNLLCGPPAASQARLVEKFSPEEIETAIEICAACASWVPADENDRRRYPLGVARQLYDVDPWSSISLALSAYCYVREVTGIAGIADGIVEAERYAEAEALLRTGWLPCRTCNHPGK